MYPWARSIILMVPLFLFKLTPVYAYTDEGRLPFYGKEGQQPAEVALDFLRGRLGDTKSPGYRRLVIDQRAPKIGESWTETEVDVVRDQFFDDSLRGLRSRTKLRLEGDVWVLYAIKEDLRCYRSKHRSFQDAPCP
jgi:hypothetical protein